MNRNFLYFLLFILFAGLPGSIAQALEPLKNDGKIAIFNYHEQEFSEISYRNGKFYQKDGLKQIDQLLRSRDGRVHSIDRRLIELIDHLQDHFGAETVEVISGYRSPAYNRSLRMNGRDVAGESLHMKGIAADIHIDEIDEETLFDYVRSLGLGGVGLYPRYAFVHIDVGPVRTWRGKPVEKRILVGTENNPNAAWAAITDRNHYVRNEKLTVAVTNNGYERERLTPIVWIERFRKGRWGDQRKIRKMASARLKPGQSQTLTWTIPEDQPLGKYRLVIFPSTDFTTTPPMFSNEFYVRK